MCPRRSPTTAAPTPDHKRYFIEKLGLSERLMERCLGEALSAAESTPTSTSSP